MSYRLVIPKGAKPDDVLLDDKGLPKYRDRADEADPLIPKTWRDAAAEGGCDGIEIEGSDWCVANRITGVGYCTEDSGEPAPPPDPVDVPAPVPTELEAKVDALTDAVTALIKKLGG